jgi:hypothetical protein
MSNPESLQVSHALITGSNICIDYRSKNGAGATSSGIAVYEADKNLLFVDNSWIWQRACLFGKYAQRREGADVTEAASGALKTETAATLGVKEEPVARPLPPAKSRKSSAHSTQAIVATLETVQTATARPVTAPVDLPAPAAKQPAAIVVKAPVAVTRVVEPAAPAPPAAPVVTEAHSSAIAEIASVPVAIAVAPPRPPAAAPTEPHLAGAVIIGSEGTVPAATESLADAARRLKKEKMQRQQKRVP